MANKKISEFTALGEAPASDDVVAITDTSDSVTKKVTVSNLLSSSHTHTASNLSDVTASAAELNHSVGVSSAIQTQLDAKAASSHTHDPATDLSAAVPYAKGGTGLTGLGTSGQVLKTNDEEDGVVWGDDSGGGGGGSLDNLSEDTTPQLGGSLDVNSNSIVSVSDGDIAITPDGDGKVILDGLNWPIADGDASQVLKTDGGGNLSFVAQSGGSGTVTSVTAGAGLTQSGTDTINPTIDVVGGDGITAAADEIEVAVDDATIELSASDGSGTVRAKTAAVADSETALATGDQIFDYVAATSQPLNTDLSAIAGLTSAADKGIQFTGSGTAATYDLTTAGKALLDDADAATQLATLSAAGTGLTNSFSEPQRGAVDSSQASTGVFDLSEANNHSTTISGATVVSYSNAVAGQSGVITITQDGSTVITFSTDWNWEGGTIPTPSTSGVDLIAYYCESSSRVSAVYIKGSA